MRTVPASVQAKLDTDYGTEPIILVEIEWVSGSPILYSDQKINGADYPYPTILSMGGFDTSMMLSGASDSLQLSLQLDDVDGHLKDIYLANDVHKRPVKIFLTYKGLNLADRILLFKGEVVTPFEWDEGMRSLSFTVLSKLEETEVGFSMEEGDFPNIPEEALGKAWPLVFGQVCHMPAVKIRAARQGILLSGEGISDPTIHARLCQATQIQCPAVVTSERDIIGCRSDRICSTLTQQAYGPDLECLKRRYGEICTLKDLLEQQGAYENSTLNIFNGVSFPQGDVVSISIDGAIFKGTFSGNTFTVMDRKHPDYDEFSDVQCVSIPSRYYGSVIAPPTDSWESTNSGTGYSYRNGVLDAAANPPDPFNVGYANGTLNRVLADCDATMTRTPGAVGGSSASWQAYDDMPSAGFAWLSAGTEVYMVGEEELLFIVSLIPGTVDMVSAYRKMANGDSLLAEVPAENYTVYETDYDGYTVVELGLSKPLSQIDEDFEDTLYVSFTSSVGPNVADIIQWLVEKYTDLSVDATSFASVHAATTKYPCNFYLQARPSVYAVIQDLAYQSRCSVYIRNDVVYLTYLSVEPTSIRTLTEDDILLGSFIESLSDTDDIITTHNIAYQKAGARIKKEDSIDFKIRLKYNVDKYGTSDQSWNYYTQNTYDTILKSSTFWLIRKAASWKKLKFDLTVKHIDLDVNDAITIDVAQFSSTPIKCVIESSQYNPADNVVSVECWTPIRAGEIAQYYWAWPSQQTATAVWPLPGDNNGGGGYSFEVAPPIGHLLLGGATNEDQLQVTTGDLNPSDLDDTLPVVTCLVSDIIDFNETEPVIKALEVAQSAARQTANAQQGGGSGSKDDEDDSDGDCGFPLGGSCGYKVTQFWHQSTKQGKGNNQGENCGGPCVCAGGCPSCVGLTWTKCSTFGTTWAAQMAFANAQGAEKSLVSWWDCMEIAQLTPKIEPGRLTDEITGLACGDVFTPSSSGDDSPNSNVGPTNDNAPEGAASEASGGSGDST